MKKQILITAGVLQVFLLVAGAAVSAIMAAWGQRPLPTYGTEIYSIMVLIMLIFIVVIEIGSVFKIHDSTIHTVFTSCALLLSYLFSYDLHELFNPGHSAAVAAAYDYVSFITFHLVVLSHLYLINFLYKTEITKKTGAAAIIFAASDCALFAALKAVQLGWVAYIAYIPMAIYFTVRIFINARRKKCYDLTFLLTITILAASSGMSATAFIAETGLINYRIYGIDTTYILIINLLYVSIYVAFMLRTERRALEASEYKLEAERMKTKLLREQINPHFIFNSLITVKNAYHADAAQGDEAMNYFSRYLRANVNAMNLDLIPFSEELDNIENYIGLVNMRRKKPVNITYNIECDDFCVPVLALQVFVENAVKYAHTDERDDGFILVSAADSPEGTVVEVADNGVGFDTDAIKETSCGIRNAKERFKLLMGTAVDIASGAGQGTRVKITIPDKFKTNLSGGGISVENYYC